MTSTTESEGLFGVGHPLYGAATFVGATLVRYSPLFALIVVWQLLGVAGVLPTYVPPPDAVFESLVGLYRSGQLVSNAVASLQIVYTGFVLGGAAGVVLGVLSGRIGLLSRLFDPLVSLTYPVPKIAFFPLFLVWLGLGFKSKAVVLVLAVFYPVYINTYDGARGVNELYVWSARNFDAGRLRVLAEVVFPKTLPHVFSGLRVGMALGFIVVFSAELIQSEAGLGHLIQLAQAGQNFPLMYAAIVLVAVLGFFHERAVRLLGQRLVYWDTTEGL